MDICVNEVEETHWSWSDTYIERPGARESDPWSNIVKLSPQLVSNYKYYPCIINSGRRILTSNVRHIKRVTFIGRRDQCLHTKPGYAGSPNFSNIVDIVIPLGVSGLVIRRRMTHWNETGGECIYMYKVCVYCWQPTISVELVSSASSSTVGHIYSRHAMTYSTVLESDG